MNQKLSNITLPLLVYSIFGLIIFASFSFWIKMEMDRLDIEINQLEDPSNRSFAVLQEFHSKGRKFTYQVSDERGRIHEITEVVDENTSRKLRVGDTIPIYRKTVRIFGKRTIISRILASEKKTSSLQEIYSYAWNGSLFFGFATIIFIGMIIISKKE